RQLQSLTMTIRADEDESFVVERLFREKRNGTITRINEDTWQFAATVYDALEMLPWIRTFTGRIVSLTCTDPGVTERFYGDLKEMYLMYLIHGGDDSVV
ncbi:MAG: WYL domain-containing protein, partial [Parasporobacterium sp.]|nr:WYL domain-containing protein [Parasporobacterium sp.]